MQVCTLLQTDNHASTQFLQAGCSSCHPTNSVKALKAYSILNMYDCMEYFEQDVDSIIGAVVPQEQHSSSQMATARVNL